MGVPASACFKILMIKLSEYLDVFIENLLKSRLFDFLLLNSIIFREDYRISQDNRAKIVEGLSRLLADSYTLYLMTHNFHWNVTGPQFNSLHNMFMDQYTEQWNALDVIAERIRALGFPAPGTYKQFVKLASIKEVESVPKANEMIQLLVNAHEAVARTARSIFDVVDEANDQPTADVLTQRLDIHEKTAWMLRSLLE